MAKSFNEAHSFFPNMTEETLQKMLSTLGLSTLDDLYKDIDPNLFVKHELNLPRTHSELETQEVTMRILQKNIPFRKFSAVFLGGGVYNHYVPKVVDAIASRSEFYTSYTPYAPELQQGLLQTMWEYQSLVAEILAMDVVNASMYDGATALGEAALMSARFLKRRKKILIPKIISPAKLKVLYTYTHGPKLQIESVNYNSEGMLDLDDLKSKLDENVAGVYIENPNYFGIIETQVDEIAQLTHDNGSLLIVGVNPMSLGILRPPGAYDADIVVGEAQVLGSPTSFGGPLLGIFSCKNNPKLIRTLPGRLIGLTKEKRNNERAFCMTLTTREQHIKRERATSNICSNEALMTVRSAVYLSLIGFQGLKHIGESCISKTKYLIDKIESLAPFEIPFAESPHFNEFLVRIKDVDKQTTDLQRYLLEKANILGGFALDQKTFPEFHPSYLFAVTETNSFEQLNALLRALKEF